MEAEGFGVDAEGIRAFGITLQKEVNEVQAQIIEEVGYEFNINSPKQLGEALFVKLGLPHGKKPRPDIPPTWTCWKSCDMTTR